MAQKKHENRTSAKRLARAAERAARRSFGPPPLPDALEPVSSGTQATFTDPTNGRHNAARPNHRHTWAFDGIDSDGRRIFVCTGCTANARAEI